MGNDFRTFYLTSVAVEYEILLLTTCIKLSRLLFFFHF